MSMLSSLSLRLRPGAGVEGEGRHVTIVLEFPTVDAARAWYADPDYQAILAGRIDNTANGSAVIIDRFTPPT